MKRAAITPRPDWQARVEEVGLTYHTPNDQPYWDETACYQLDAREVDVLEAAANELHMRCIDAAENVIQNNRFEQLGIPAAAVPSIKNSWERDDFSLYGRFDFAWDGKAPPKMLEYNADTPTALVEAAVAQWYWLEDTRKERDQFNSIHERLIAAWKLFGIQHSGQIHLGGVKDNLEDAQTVLYVQDTCHQGGLRNKQLFIEDLGYDDARKRFVDLENEVVHNYFKLYPWEWMWHEEFSVYLASELCNIVEPMWKMLLSNKGLLPVLWELFPGHPNLLPAYFSEREFRTGETDSGFVKKPKLSREGANISIIQQGAVIEASDGEYGEEGYVYQARAQVPSFDGNHPILGVWVINHEAAGLGIREDRALITGNLSRFVPHFF